MTSVLSRDDLDDELYRCGIRSAVVRAHLLRKIEMYARKYPVPEPIPDDIADHSGYKYMCPSCNTRKHIGDFPEYKKSHRRSPVPCSECKAGKP